MAVRLPLTLGSGSPSHRGSHSSSPCATSPVGWSTSTVARHDRFRGRPPGRRIPIPIAILWILDVVLGIGLALPLLGSTAHRRLGRRHYDRSDHRPPGGFPDPGVALRAG